MPGSIRSGRLERAQELRRAHPEAVSLLTFYEQLLRFQENLDFDAAPRPSTVSDWGSAAPPESPNLTSCFLDFVSFIRDRAPAPLAEAAADFCARDFSEHRASLQACWLNPEPVGDAHAQFIYSSFLQPYAQSAARIVPAQPRPLTPACCPVCGHKPGAAALRQLGDGGKKFLVCSFCTQEWQFRRILCPSCGEEDPEHLPVYRSQADFDYIRLDCCDRCKQYLKSMDLTRNGLADPVVDEIASVTLDLWAKEKGYSKIMLNVLGL